MRSIGCLQNFEKDVNMFVCLFVCSLVAADDEVYLLFV